MDNEIKNNGHHCSGKNAFAYGYACGKAEVAK